MKSNAFLNLVVVIVLVGIGYWAVTSTGLFKNLSLNEQSLVGAPAAVSTAVLGTNSIGSILDEGSVNAINASPYTMPAEGGKAVSISVYIENIEAGSQFGLAIYDDVNGKPGKLVASTPAQTLDGSVAAGWKTVPITADLKANTKYWLAYNANAVGTKKNLLRYVPATPGSNVWKFIGLGVWPADYPTAPGSTGEGSNLISIYITYEKPVTTTTTTTSYTPVAPNTNFAVGSRITVSQGPVNVRSATSRSSNNIVGTQPTGAFGNIIQGPVNQAGFTWWKVDYDTGVDGWTTGAYHYVVGVLNTTSSSGGSTSSSSGSTSSSSSGTPAPIPFTFRLFDGSNKTIVQGASATSSVTVQKVAGTAEVVNFSVSGLPTGVGGTFSPTSCTPNTSCSSTLTLTAQASASIGTRTVTITGSSNSTSTNTSFVLTIDAAPVIVVPPPTTTPPTGLYKAGDRVRVTQGPLNVRSSTEITLASKLGEEPTNALGTVAGGPANGVGNDLTWWKIDYDPYTNSLGQVIDLTGWSTQNYITLASGYVPPTPIPTPIPTPTTTPATTTPPAKSTTFKAGDKIEVIPGTNTLNVRSGPGTNYGIVTTKTGGDTGIVQADPNLGLVTLTDGNEWWRVDFGGLVGWAAEAFLRLFQGVTLPPLPAGGGVPVGAGLEFPWDTMRSKMFADVIYSARPFETTSVDASGWPQGDFVVKVSTESADVPNGANRIDMTGTFTLAFNGQADVGVVGGSLTGMRYNSATNQSVAEVTFAPSVDYTWTYAFNFTNTKRMPTSPLKSGVTEVRLIRPGHVVIASNGEYKASQKFSKEFLTDIAPLSVLRLMDYMETNLVWADGDTDQRIATLGTDGKMDWSERPSLSRRSVDNTFGGPIEHMVDLANISGKDLWINIPHTATDDYTRGLATYIKNNLTSNSKIYVEWSNEVWNCGQFRQCQDAGKWGGELGLSQRQYTIKRVIDAGLIFRSVFGDAAMMAKIRPIYADQFASPGETAAALAWAYKNYPNLTNYYLYGLAIAPYYGSGDASDAGTATQILAGMVTGINGRLNAIMDIRDRGGTYVDFHSIARSYGLKYLTYEGGTDLGYSSINAVNKIIAQNSLGMKDRTLGYLGQWNACGGDLFTYFTFSWAMTGKFQWGLTDNAGTPLARQPKLAGAHQAANTDERYFECAPLDPATNFFSYNPAGTVGTGSGLTGTYYSDNNLTTVAKLKDGSSVVRIDPVINFIWNNYGAADAYPRLDYTGGVHTFSTKWTGRIQPKFDADYKFEMQLDAGDSVTVKINGQTLTSSQTIRLNPNSTYPIEIVYQPNGAGGIARLWWSSTGGTSGNQIRAVVPQGQLYPN